MSTNKRNFAAEIEINGINSIFLRGIKTSAKYSNSSLSEYYMKRHSLFALAEQHFEFLFRGLINVCVSFGFSLQIFQSIVILCALALPMTTAVINSPSEKDVERREGFETYGPPPLQQQIVLPTPVYGPPAVSKYPPPPPERPPPPSHQPSKEYGK